MDSIMCAYPLVGKDLWVRSSGCCLSHIHQCNDIEQYRHRDTHEDSTEIIKRKNIKKDFGGKRKMQRYLRRINVSL